MRRRASFAEHDEPTFRIAADAAAQEGDFLEARPMKIRLVVMVFGFYNAGSLYRYGAELYDADCQIYIIFMPVRDDDRSAADER